MPEDKWGAYLSWTPEASSYAPEDEGEEAKKKDKWATYQSWKPTYTAPVPSKKDQARALMEQVTSSGRVPSLNPVKDLAKKYAATVPQMGTGDYWKQAGSNLVNQAKGFVPGMAKLAKQTLEPITQPGHAIMEQGMEQAAAKKAEKMGIPQEQVAPSQPASTPLKNMADLALFIPKTIADTIKDPVGMLRDRPLDLMMLLSARGVHAAKRALTVDVLKAGDMKAAFMESLANQKKFQFTPEEVSVIDYLNKSLEEPGTIYGKGGEVVGVEPKAGQYTEPFKRMEKATPIPETAENAPPSMGEVRGLSVQYVDKNGKPISQGEAFSAKGRQEMRTTPAMQAEELSQLGPTSNPSASELILKDAVLYQPNGNYLLSREGMAAPSLRAAVEKMLGYPVSPGALEKVVRGLSVNHPDSVKASLTLGLDEVILSNYLDNASTTPTPKTTKFPARNPGPGEVRGLCVEFVDKQVNSISRADAFRAKPNAKTEPVSNPKEATLPVVAPSIQGSEPLTPQAMVLEVLREEKKLRRKQKGLYTKERSDRFAQALQIGQENPTVEGFRQQLQSLKGELPKVNREAPLEAFPTEVTNGLIKEIDAKIPGMDSVRAKGALLKLFEGGNPLQPKEISLLTEALGKEFVGEVIGADPKWKSAALDVLGLPRAIMSSADLSFGLRQGVMMAASHPSLFAKSFGKQFQFFASEKAYRSAMDAIAKDEFYDLAVKSKLSLTELGKDLAKKEEPYQTSLAEKIPIVKQSSRAYAGFANKLRFDTFKHLVKQAENLGHDVIGDPKLAKDIADVVNVATGRGRLGKKLEPAAVALNNVFFSPRLLASRIQTLNPAWYMKLDPFARKQAIRNVVATATAGATVLGLAKMSGAEIGLDPRSADFGKIKVGDTRIDIWGGFAQYPRIAAQMITGKLISTTSGKVSTLGEGYRPLNRADILQRFFENKEAPIFSFVMGALRGEGQIGGDFKIGSEVANRFVPMIVQDAIDLYKEDPELMPLTFLGALGVGLQTYSGNKPSSKKKPQMFGGW